MKQNWKSGCAIFVATAVLAACSTNKDVITMKGGAITQHEIYDKLKIGSAAIQTFQTLTIMKVFEDKYGDQITDKEVTAEYNKTAKQGGDNFEKQLKAAGYTKDTFKEKIKQRLAYNKGLEKHVKLTNADLKTAWKSFHPTVGAQVIKLASEDAAKEVKKAADSKEDFTKLAKEKSTDKATKNDGGKMVFDSQSTKVPPEVKEAAFKLKNNEISKVIPAADASTYTTSYYVVKMVKAQDKGSNMDKYKEQLKDIAKQLKLKDKDFITKTIGEELKEANVKIKDDRFKDALSEFTVTSNSTNSSATSSSTTTTSK